MPRTYLIDSPQPNAFATGRNPQNAAVAASTGLLERLSREEVAAVMAHELAHVEHRDTLTMTITATLAGAISMLGNFAFFFGGNRDNNNPLGFIGVLVAMIVAPLAAMLVQMAVSRTREYSADRRGAEICGNPLWLASALDKIARTAERIPNPAAERNPATAHLFIINPLSGQGMDNLFSTHPSTDNRIAALEAMAGEFASRKAAPGAASRTPQPGSGPWGRNPTGPRTPQPDRTQRPVVVTARPLPGWAKEKADQSDNIVAGLAARMAAAKLLAAVIDARTPLDGLTDHDHGHPNFRALDMRDRGLVRAILATALRFRGTISRLLAARLERPLPANAHQLSHVLHVGAAQMLFLDIPDSAAVDLAVTHAKSDPRTARFSGLVNGVLRGLARDKDSALPPELAKGDEAPGWFRDRLAAAYGTAKAQAILAAHRIEAPVDFTVKSDPQRWAEAFGGVVLPTGSIRIEHLAGPVAELPGYADGEWWVQDAAASLPARLLGNLAGPKRRRPLRGTRRQDRAARACRRRGDGNRFVEEQAAAPRRKPSTAAAASHDGRSRCAEIRAGPIVRRGAARCPLLVDRHRAASSRHSLDEELRGHRQAGGPAAAAARRRRAHGEARRPRRLFQLLARPGRRRTACRRFPGRACRFRARPGAAGRDRRRRSVHCARRNNPHDAGRPRSRQARDFRPRRFLRGANAAASLKRPHRTLFSHSH